MFVLTLSEFTLSFSHCNLIKSFSYLAVMTPTEELLNPGKVSKYVWDIVVSVPSKSMITSL